MRVPTHYPAPRRVPYDSEGSYVDREALPHVSMMSVCLLCSSRLPATPETAGAFSRPRWRYGERDCLALGDNSGIIAIGTEARPVDRRAPSLLYSSMDVATKRDMQCVGTTSTEVTGTSPFERRT